MDELSFDIKRAQPDEAEEIIAAVELLLTEMGGGPPGLDIEALVRLCRDMLTNDPQYAVFVARGEDGVMLGFVTVYEISCLHARGRMGFIEELYVNRENRSQGIGSQLKEPFGL